MIDLVLLLTAFPLVLHDFSLVLIKFFFHDRSSNLAMAQAAAAAAAATVAVATAATAARVPKPAVEAAIALTIESAIAAAAAAAATTTVKTSIVVRSRLGRSDAASLPVKRRLRVCSISLTKFSKHGSGI